jgi:hypothetical protein
LISKSNINLLPHSHFKTKKDPNIFSQAAELLCPDLAANILDGIGKTGLLADAAEQAARGREEGRLLGGTQVAGQRAEQGEEQDDQLSQSVPHQLPGQDTADLKLNFLMKRNRFNETFFTYNNYYFTRGSLKLGCSRIAY